LNTNTNRSEYKLQSRLRKLKRGASLRLNKPHHTKGSHTIITLSLSHRPVWPDHTSKPLYRFCISHLLTPLPGTASVLLLEYFLLVLTVHLCTKLSQSAAFELVSGRASEALKDLVRT
jgi:hypothetical protein